MADDEEPQFSSLKDRIAALNQQKSFQGGTGTTPPASAAAAKKRPPPPPPPSSQSVASPSPAAAASKGPPPLPRRDTQSSQLSETTNAPTKSLPPALPSRTASSTSLVQQGAPPLMPPRRPSALSRKDSASSVMSQQSVRSTAPTISSMTSQGSEGGTPRFKLPPKFDQASLPPLPPSRRELEAKKAAEEAERTAAGSKKIMPSPTPPASSTPKSSPMPKPGQPGLPPRLPSRPGGKIPSSTSSPDPQGQVQTPPLKALPPATPNLRSNAMRGFGDKRTADGQPATGLGLSSGAVRGFGEKAASSGANGTNGRPPIKGFGSDKPPSIPQRPSNDEPPPIPLSSKPSMAQIQAIVDQPVGISPADQCWICKDWSEPDRVASMYPRQSLPRSDPVGYLAQNLCGPFPSYNDKARAIFTWFHHNVAYDCHKFFNKTQERLTVEETIFEGRAVCQGYAEVYKAIANRAGLDCVLVSGHGKGFGHTALKEGESPPPEKATGHAWNAVRIDGGGWKLLDACWGAGHISGETRSYTAKFSPEQFNVSNEKFGQRHFPKEKAYQFREDGRTITWDEYFIGKVHGPPVQTYGNTFEESIETDSIEPKTLKLATAPGNDVVRIQFHYECEHWSEKDPRGKPPLFILAIHGANGGKDDWIPMETDGYWHWMDVRRRDLGAPGQDLLVLVLLELDGRSARGVSPAEFKKKLGRCKLDWRGVMKWDLV